MDNPQTVGGFRSLFVSRKEAAYVSLRLQDVRDDRDSEQNDGKGMFHEPNPWRCREAVHVTARSSSALGARRKIRTAFL